MIDRLQTFYGLQSVFYIFAKNSTPGGVLYESSAMAAQGGVPFLLVQIHLAVSQVEQLPGA